MSTAYEDAIAEAEYWALRASDAMAADDPLEHAEAADKWREARAFAASLTAPGPSKGAKPKPVKESVEQAALVAYLKSRGWLYLATANGVPMTARARTQFARSGGQRGTPDVLSFDSVGPYIGLAVEMKRTTGSKTSPEQKRWRKWLEDRGWLAIIAKGANDAIRQIEAAEELEA